MARDRYTDVDLFVDVLAKINQFYVDPVDPSELVEGAVSGMLRELDPFSAYLDEDSFNDLQITTQGKFGRVARRHRCPRVELYVFLEALPNQGYRRLLPLSRDRRTQAQSELSDILAQPSGFRLIGHKPYAAIIPRMVAIAMM